MDKKIKKTTPADLCMIGAFPEPLCGLSFVNLSVKNCLEEKGAALKVVCLPFTLNRTLRPRLMRTAKILMSVFRFLTIMALDPCGKIYLSFSGGLGQLYDILFLSIARLFRKEIFLHHHSYAYLDRRKGITHWALLAAGKKAVHITLSHDMAAQLNRLYPIVSHTMSISNAAFLEPGPNRFCRPKARLETIGFLGNISQEKGIFHFLDVVEELEAKQVRIKAVIAGPFENPKTENEVRHRLNRLKTAHYVGPKYGDQKTAFYETVDGLLFPTCYSNEAEPLVILEAMRQWIPVIAWSRGCIAEMIPPESGLVIPPGTDFVPAAVRQLVNWHSSPDRFSSVSANAGKQFLRLHQLGRKNLEIFSQYILSDASGFQDDERRIPEIPAP